MLKLLSSINHTMDNKLNKRLGLRKRVYSIITEAMLNTPQSSISTLFFRKSIIDKELLPLLIAYRKTYNLDTQTMTNISEEVISIIDNLCYIMNERFIYRGSFNMGISCREFVDKVLIEAFKDN